MITAVYPGTFDPLTNGHVDIIQRAAVLFDNVIVAVAASVGKQPYFPLSDRLAMCEAVFSQLANVSVETFDGLLVEFLTAKNANVVLRGLRSAADLDFEFQLSAMNKLMLPDCETLFMRASEDTGSISSSIVREIAAMGGDVSLFVPELVAKKLNS